LRGDPSLARRVVGYLVVAQLVAFLIGATISMALELAEVAYYRLSLDELAVNRVSKLVTASLILGEDGLVRIEPSPELRAEMQRTPNMKFAAFDLARRPLFGSSPELVSTLIKAGVIQISAAHLHFNLPTDLETTPMGFMERRRTPFGKLHIAVYGQKFRWLDIFVGYLADELSWLIVYFLVVILGSTGTAWFAVQFGLTPLREAALQAGRIDLDSMNHSVVAPGIPIEIRPFVTAINSALARLDASAKRMRRYTANAAHELRTPLAILRARLENAEESPAKSDLLLDASRLDAVVEQLLIAARLTERHATIDQEVDLIKTIRQVIFGYVRLAIECDRMIEFEAGTSPVVIRGNQRAIESVVSNLVDNALRAEPRGGTVLVRVSDCAVIEVIDHGAGVALSDREKIFEPFWRGNEATPGTGLGLAIAKELVDKHQGRIWVDETPGGGATFKLSFPGVNSN
jgi:two-component system OmpR family sensor kinase